MSGIKVPVVLNFFNREKTTIRVFERIKEVRPEKLYLISDGPRNEKEKKIISELREKILNAVDWECEVLTNFSEKNLGCRDRIVSGYDWVFEKEDMAILLEDDTLPLVSFFYYAQELLYQYKDDTRVAFISGNKLEKDYEIDCSYAFSFFASNWGWATWARAWKWYDGSIENWNRIKKQKVIDTFWGDRYRNAFSDMIYKGFSGEVNTWDFQFGVCRLQNMGMGITPQYNLIQNIGFGMDEATHTSGENLYDFSVRELEFPLIHPKNVFPDVGLDQFHLDHITSLQVEKNKYKYILGKQKQRFFLWIKKLFGIN